MALLGGSKEARIADLFRFELEARRRALRRHATHFVRGHPDDEADSKATMLGRAEMTLQELGSIGEFVAAIATVATLAYLATQIRYARLVASDTSRQSRAEGVREMQLLALNNEAFRTAWNKAETTAAPRMEALSDKLGVSPDEANLIWHGCCAWTYIHWAQYRSMKTASDRRELETLIREFYSIPPMVSVWKTDPMLKAMVDPEFVEWVDEILSRAPTR
jgi:hypothetical protein